MSVSNPTIGFAGLTHLGINSLVAAAERGFQVLGFDQDQDLISSLSKLDLRVEEPQLAEYLNKNKDLISFTFKKEDLYKCDLVYISTDVPTDDQGQSDLRIVNDIISTVLKFVKKTATVVILCQVNPGYTRGISLKHENLYYQVETLVFGNAMQRAIFPERFIVGCRDVARDLPSAYQVFLDSFKCPILKMKYESAELAKIAINMFLISSVSTTNMLAEVCENIGASWAEIAPALRLDKRIGQYAYLKPGLGISGGNLERDISTISSISKNNNLNTALLDSWTLGSRARKDWAYKILSSKLELVNTNHIIGVLGLAYKENTHSIKNSPSIELLKKISKLRIKVYDPVVKDIPGYQLDHAESISSLLDDIDVLVVMTPWDEFKNIPLENLLDKVREKILIDPFGLYNSYNLASYGFSYFCLGENG